jgi:hypothetical protein
MIDIAPSVWPTPTDESIFPEVMLKEISDPPVADPTKPTLPLDAISGCARSSSTAEDGSETVRT